MKHAIRELIRRACILRAYGNERAARACEAEARRLGWKGQS